MTRAAIEAVLMAAGRRGDALDRRVFSAIAAAALADRTMPLADRLGLSPAGTRLLFAAYFPAFPMISSKDTGAGDQAPEEEDLRRLLLLHRAGRRPEEEWLAAIIARRAQGTNHLWEDLGLSDRGDLNRLMARFFPTLFAKNRDNMRWKKFFYRLLCEQEGFHICKSPCCTQCTDIAICFEPGSRVLMNRAG